MRAALAAVALLLAGCVGSTEPVSIDALDVDAYVAHVHPVVRFGCASLDCHGDAARPLRLYAEDGLRIDAALRGEPLSAEEAAWNVAAIAGLDPEAPSVEANLVLLKPLAVGAGGVAHVGGDRWLDTSDPSYVCMHGWMAGRIDDPTVLQACERAEALLDPSPDTTP